jgi:DUF4097 and DUF4098 domain-containing protein YvlB
MMKTIIKTIIKTGVVLIMGLLSLTISAQKSEQELVVPLSNPGRPGTLEVSILYGSISVTGTSAKDVIIHVSTEQKKVENTSKNGLRKIPNNSFGLRAEEDDNNVKVSTDLSNKNVNLDIKVPQNFNLKLRAVNDGDISVENISGEIDINHVNGDITSTNVSGSVIANTTNGDVKVAFNSITPDTPMSFTSFNGDVDVTLPANIKASAKMRSDMGEIYTDFDMTMKNNSSPKEEKDVKAGVYKVSIEKWMYGDINGGGPEMTFKSFNGDIIIRSK